MAKLKIIHDDNPLLRKASRPVDEITPRIHTLLDDMAETMRAAKGCGLAAVQVGVLRRVVVIETEPDNLIELINPVIISSDGTQTDYEGCLSVPGKVGITERPMNVTVRALDRDGEEIEIVGNELLAKALCHEIDHLDGKLYTDLAIRMLSKEELEDFEE